MALGKGLNSLIPPKLDPQVREHVAAVLPSDERIVQMPVEKIQANPQQPRTVFDHDGLEDLMNSIKEHGILQPLIVAPAGEYYHVIAGERRWRAAQMLDLKTVPAVVRDMGEQQKLELALVENIQRRDLNPIEEAVAYQRLIDEFNVTQDEAARRVGKSRSAVTNTLRLLTLPSDIQKALINGKISFSAARVIVGLPADEQMKFFEQILKNDLTVRAIEGQARKVSVRTHIRKTKDPNIAALEERLQAKLGTRVTIKKTGDAGHIVIEFYSAEDLQSLLDQLEA